MGELTSRRTARRQIAIGRVGTPIEKLLAEARLKLIETGTRNRLIHTPRGAKRSRALTITGNASDDVFANLVRENKPTAYSPDLDPIDPSAGSEVFANFPPAFPPSRACCNLKPDSRKNRLRKIARRTVDALWDALGLARLPSKRRLQLFPNCRIWFHLIGTCSSPSPAGPDPDRALGQSGKTGLSVTPVPPGRG